MRLMNHLRKTSDGQWEVRITVPADCRDRIGKSNLTKRLGRVTKSEANKLAAGIVEDFKMQIERARLPMAAPAVLDPQQAIAALTNWRDAEIQRVRTYRFNNPGYGYPSDINLLGEWIEQSARLGREQHLLRQKLTSGLLPSGFDGKILKALADRGIVIDSAHPAMPNLRLNFAKMYLDVMDAEDLAQSGEYGVMSVEVSAPSAEVLRPAISTDELIQGYAAERQPPPNTLQKWQRVMASLTAHIGHNGSVANMGHGRAASPSWGIRQHWRNAY